MRGEDAVKLAEQHLGKTVTKRLAGGLCVLKSGEKEFKGGTWKRALKSLVSSTKPKTV
jgi:hypothetical protein